MLPPRRTTEPIVPDLTLPETDDMIDDDLSSLDADIDYYKQRYHELKQELEDAQDEHERSLRAMQRVMAESLQPDVTVVDNGQVEEKRWSIEKTQLQRELDSKTTRITSLERQLKVAKVKKPATDLQKRIDELEQKNQELMNGDKALAEKTAALEKAKLIITSLESASGSMANETRTKLRQKDEQVSVLQKESASLQKRLDSLAQELRTLQRQQAKAETQQQADRQRQQTLRVQLEENLSQVRSATVVLESTQDPQAVEGVTETLVQSITLLKAAIETMETDDADSLASGRSRTENRGSKEDKVLIQKLEEELRKERTEALKFRFESERTQQERDVQMQELMGEMQRLREQCSTNLEVLTKKERELVVLRDSLKVDDDVGYISDDATEFDDEEEGATGTLSSPYLGSSQYGHSQAEALATLLATAPSFDKVGAAENGDVQKELAQARKDHDLAKKQLKAERQSLANAKSIISSLEKANKSMMEDLRSRLQDSNTAIASLLDKSMQSEKSASRLKAELDQLKQEREEERIKYEQRIQRLSRADFDPFTSDLSLVVRSDEKKEDRIITETID